MIIKDNVLIKVEDSDIVNGTCVIPEGVTEIGAESFMYCESLQEITIPKGVTYIGNSAFSYCKSLQKITIPEGVKDIGYHAFLQCKNLQKIIIPEGITEIKWGVLGGCESLQEIIIPESVTEIGTDAFYGCRSLKEIIIPEKVTIIRGGVFGNCKSLQEITIPEGVISIGNGAFEYCRSLREIIIPKGVISIKDRAFSFCESLQEITIPKGVISIGNGAFEFCKSLQEITIPEGAISISYGAFEFCKSLQKIIIPESVKEIEENAFKDCPNLKEIILPSKLDENMLEQLYISQLPGILEMMFGENLNRFEEIKSESNFSNEEVKENKYYDKRLMDIFYFRMMKSIGMEEIEKIIEIPDLTKEEIEEYMIEKDQRMMELYEKKYKIVGDLGIVLDVFRGIDFEKYRNNSKGKNNAEIKIFRELNKLLDSGEKGSLREIITKSIKRAGYEIKDGKEIQELEKRVNGQLIKENFAKIKQELEKSLSDNSQEHDDPIVREQVKLIVVMIENSIEKLFKEKGELNKEELKENIIEKISEANSPYIVQNKENIVKRVMQILEKEEILQTLNYSALDAIKNTKKQIGDAWKYKINRALRLIGYTIKNFPEYFKEGEMQKLKQEFNLKIDIQTNEKAVLKDEDDRELAYELLAQKGIPKIVTYKQIHDMFGTVHGPYSEEFKKFFKKHREEF